MDENLLSLSTSVGKALLERAYTISTAESCTSGLLSHTLTAISGSSAYFIGGVVAYSNEIKVSMLDVQIETLEKFGAVSVQTAQEMAEGIRERFQTEIGLSTTGIAGPTGGTPTKPVGLVCMGISTPEKTLAFDCHFTGERLQVMHSTVVELLTRLTEML